MSTSAHYTSRIPGCTTPEQADRFMAAAAAKVQGSSAAAPGPAEILRELAANQGRVSAADTPEVVAEFVTSAGIRARNVAAASPAATPDMTTAEGVALFVLNAGRRTARA